MATKSELGRIREILGHHADSVGRDRSGDYIARRGYFYRHGVTAKLFAQTVTNLLDVQGIKIEVVDSWDKFTHFIGGASIANQSHFGVKFRVIIDD